MLTFTALISVFWSAPKVLNQTFLVNSAVLVSINIMRNFPEWGSWALLIVLVIWDLIAVLCPYGPLRLLISQIHKRKQEDQDYKPPPGLLYSTMVWFFIILESDPNKSGSN